jgi:pyruvate dehydrogenase E1 component beta subunit
VAKLTFSESVDSALAQAMAENPRIVLFGEDVEMLHQGLYIRFGPERVWNAPISEAAFVGAAVAAALGGLQPVVDLMLVDFVGVAMDALLNQAAKAATFSGGRWTAPVVVRAACGAGYGDAGQHEQSLWGWLAHIPGLSIVVPSTPTDAGRLLMGALHVDGPVIFLEHKLLSDTWDDALATGGRKTRALGSSLASVRERAPKRWEPLALGTAAVRRPGGDLSIVSLGAGVHWSLEAAGDLAKTGIEAEVIDLRSVSPLDRESLCRSVRATRRMLVVDEDYEGFGLSGELAAIVLEEDLRPRYARVCTRETIPYSRRLEAETIPNRERILGAARELMAQPVG